MPPDLVLEASLSCEQHRDTVLVAGFNHFFVLDAAARLYDCSDTCSGCCFDIVSGREERIACHYGTLRVFARPVESDFHRRDAACLSDSETERAFVFRDEDCVRCEMFDYGPGEGCVPNMFFCQRACHALELGQLTVALHPFRG